MTDKTLGEYLKILRTRRGYSQEFVASHLNIIRQTYSHYETGRIFPPIEALCSLAELYQIPIDSLLKLVIKMDFDESNAVSSKSVITEEAPACLSAKETELVNFFRLLDARDKEDILDYIKLKSKKATKRK